MTSGRPFAWERTYPAGVRWDAPIRATTLPALLDQAVATYADRPAIEFRDRRITFAELGAASERAAAAFLQAGIGQGASLALYLPNTPLHPVAFFGGTRTGARLVHLSPLDAERELAHKLADSGARTMVTTNIGNLLPMALRLLDAGRLDRVIVGDDAMWGPAPAGAPAVPIPERPGVVPWRAFLESGGAAPAAWPRIAPEDIALLQYTGGTTGLPKGAVLTHANLTSAVSIYNAWEDAQGLTRRGDGRVIGVLPLFHIYALTTILLRQVHLGNEILLRQRFDVETTLADIERKRATAFPGVPTMWIALANHPRIGDCDFSALVRISSGGAPLPVEVAQRFEHLTGRKLGGGWGMTETSPAGTSMLAAGPPGSIGVPLPGIELAVAALDDPHRHLAPGEVGELCVRGPNVTSGYWNQPQATEAAFANGYFLTGDIGSMDAAGYFFLVDRKKDMIISGGFNVYPQMIEQAIYEHPAVEEVLVVGIPDPYRGEAAKAFVKLRDDAKAFTLAALQEFLRDRIGRHEMPSALEFRPSLPRTAVGKLSKLELRDEERRRDRDGLRRTA